MTEWDDILTEDIEAFMQLGAESIVYQKKGAVARTIDAIVDRDPNDMPAGGATGLRNNITVTVRNNSTTGVSATEFESGDKFKLAARKGGTTKYFENLTLIKQDAGALVFEVR